MITPHSVTRLYDLFCPRCGYTLRFTATPSVLDACLARPCVSCELPGIDAVEVAR
jgi:hypothetical protein